MSSFADLPATERSVMELRVPGAACAPGLSMLAWRPWRLLSTMPAAALFMGLLSAHAAPPENPLSNALPVADAEPKTTPLTRLMDEADKELAKGDKNRQPQEAKKEETPKERYIRLVRAQVERKWNLYLGLRPMARSPGRLEVVFYVNTEGKVEDLNVVNDKQSHPPLTEATLRAIMDAEIPPMPADVIPSLPMNDPKRLKIEYNALVYWEPKASDTKSETKAVMKEDQTAKGGYTRLVLAQVEKKWKAYHQERIKDVSNGGLKAEFYVTKTGRVENVRVVDVTKSTAILTGFTMRAIRDAELPPMPADVIPLLPKDDPERLKIEYAVLIENGLAREVKNAGVSESIPKLPPGTPIPKALPVPDDEPGTRLPFTRTTPTQGGIPKPGGKTGAVADNTPVGRYMRLVTGQVEKKWNIYRLLRRDGVTAGSLQIVFYVNQKGRVEDLKVLNDKESNKVLTAFTLQAVKDAEIPPMPVDVIPLLPKNDQERLKIEYNVLIY